MQYRSMADVMARPVRSLKRTETVETILRVLAECQFSTFPIIEGGRLLGITSRSKILLLVDMRLIVRYPCCGFLK